MIDSCARSTDGKTFTLSINGEQHTCSNDKEGKRQAILDGLNAIETVTVGQDVYLPSNESLQVVAAPRLLLNFYRPIGQVFAGQPIDLPIEILNIGRSRFNSTTITFSGDNLDVQAQSHYVGPIDSGSSATVDATGMTLTPGEARLIVRIEYVDDFNQIKTYEDALSFPVDENLFPEPEQPLGPDGGLPPVEPEPSPRPFLLRLLRGLLGLGSAR